MRISSAQPRPTAQQVTPETSPKLYKIDWSEGRSAAQAGRFDDSLLTEALRPSRGQRTTRATGPRLTFGTAALAAVGAACMVGVARAQTSSTPTPTQTPTPGVISNQGATFASWTFDDGFSVSLLAFCKQVNPARGLLRKIGACGTNTVVGEHPAGIFVGGIGKPSDCPDANTADVYTAALYVSNVIRNSTAYQCLKGLVQNPVQGP